MPRPATRGFASRYARCLAKAAFGEGVDAGLQRFLDAAVLRHAQDFDLQVRQGRRNDRRRAAVVDNQHMDRRVFAKRRERTVDVGLAVISGYQHGDVVERAGRTSKGMRGCG
jgi:hypothetical protein